MTQAPAFNSNIIETGARYSFYVYKRWFDWKIAIGYLAIVRDCIMKFRSAEYTFFPLEADGKNSSV